MSEKEAYLEAIKALSEIIKDRNDTISIQRWKIADLEAKLEAAEKEGSAK